MVKHTSPPLQGKLLAREWKRCNTQQSDTQESPLPDPLLNLRPRETSKFVYLN